MFMLMILTLYKNFNIQMETLLFINIEAFGIYLSISFNKIRIEHY